MKEQLLADTHKHFIVGLVIVSLFGFMIGFFLSLATGTPI